jgi:hypothetical protein
LKINTRYTVPFLVATDAVFAVQAIMGTELASAVIKDLRLMLQVVLRGVICLLKLWEGRLDNLTKE